MTKAKISKGMTGAFYNYIGRFGSQIIAFIVSIYVIRELPVAAFGAFSILQSILAYILIFTSSGLQHIFQRYIPDLNANKQYGEINRVVIYGIGLRLLLGIIALILIYLFAGFLGELIGLPDLSVYLPIYGWVILLTLAITLLDTALNSLLQQFAANLGLLLYSIVRAIGFYYVLTHDAGLIGILVAELIAVIVRFLVLIIAFILVLGKHLRMKAEFDDKMRRRIVDYGKWAYLNELGYLFFNTDTDNFIVGYYMGVADVGLYAFANKTARMVRDWSPIMISENVITPIFYERYSKTGDKAELDRMFGILNKLIYFINIPMLAGAIALNEKFIVLIFGEKYISATWLFVGILFYELMNGYQFPTSLVVFALEKNQLHFYSRIFSLYNLIAGLISVRYWGLWGVLIATGSAISFKALLIYLLATRHIKLSWDWKYYAKVVGASAIMGAVVYFLSDLVDNVMVMLLLVLAGSIIYLVVILAERPFSTQDLNLINHILGRNIFPLRKQKKSI